MENSFDVWFKWAKIPTSGGATDRDQVQRGILIYDFHVIGKLRRHNMPHVFQKQFLKT